MNRTAAVSDRNEFALGWRVLLAALVGVMCGFSPIPFNTFGLMMRPLNAEFGWDFAQMSLAITTFGVTGALLAPLYGYFADRFGVRPVALLSLLAFACAFAAFYFTPGNIMVFYALAFVMGLVSMGSTPVTFSRAVNMWFVKNRGLALGVMLLGTSIAAIIVPRLAVWGIETLGWRLTFPLIALMPLMIALPITLAWLREPRAQERSAELVSAGGGAMVGLSFAEATRTRQFWILFLSIVMVAFAYGGAHIHLPNIIQLHGHGPQEAASVMAMVGIAIFAGRLITGMLLDRFWAPLVTLPILSLPALSCVILADHGVGLWMIYVAAFLLGFAAGAESDLIAFLAGRYFGMAHYGRIYGMLYLPFGMFSAISPFVYGRVRDITGQYDAMLFVAAGLFVAGGAILLLMGRYPDLKARS